MPNRKSPPHLITLVLVAAVGPVVMNTFLPSLPAIARFFVTDPQTSQLSVSLFLAATAVFQLVIGPLSDNYGRRPVLIGFFVITLAATLVCIFAPNFEIFLAGRILQAASAAGMVLSRAIARDLAGPNEAASLIGYIVMGMTLMPMLAPILGGYLEDLYGWTASFYVMLGFSLLVLIIVLVDLGETNQHKSDSFTTQFREYPELVTSRRFWGYTATAAFSSGVFFAFLGGGPLVASEVFKLSPTGYGIYFAVIGMGYLIGNFFSGRVATRFGINKMMLSGNIVLAAGISVAALLASFGLQHPMSFFGPCFFLGMGNGLTLPSANAGLVSVRPKLAGSASGLGGSLQIAGGAALAIIAGFLFSPEYGKISLIIVMLASALCAIASSLYVIHVERSLSPA